MGDGWSGPLEKIDAFRYEIPRSYKPAMRTSGLIFVDEPMMALLRQDQAPEQVANVATMPESSERPWRCPTSTGDTAFRSAALRRLTTMQA